MFAGIDPDPHNLFAPFTNEQKRKKKKYFSNEDDLTFYITSRNFIPTDNRSSLFKVIWRETQRFVCVCLCTVYNARDARTLFFFCSQPYLTSSQSCYINKNRVTSPARALKNRLKNYGLNVSRNRILVIINANNADSSSVWQDSDINIGDALSLCRVDLLLAIEYYNCIIAPLAIGSLESTFIRDDSRINSRVRDSASYVQ